MRASVASLSRKFISVFFAATLALGLVPAAAFAAPNSLSLIPEGERGAVPIVSGAEGGGDDVLALRSEATSSVDGDGAASTSENVPDNDDHVISSGASEAGGVEKSHPSSEGEDTSQVGDGSNSVAFPAGAMINQEMPLDTVAQAESTRSFFLAQTLESTKTVPVVSAKLPLDTGANDAADAPAEDGASPSEGEGSDGSEGDPGSDDPVDPSFTLGSSEGDSAAVAAESTVIGSFEYRGITYAIEPGGESVAIVAADYAKLPTDFIEAQTIVLPSVVSPDDIDYYSVTRIADDAFVGLTKENANPDYVGCEALFSDEELLAEAGIDPSEVAEFLPDDGAAAAAQEGESANADSDIQAQAEACAYGDQATSNDDIRTIVSMEGNVAKLDDGSTYTFANPLAGCAGILALGIPASVTTIEDDAFSGFSTLQYIVVSEDNQSYASYDGALYSADLVQLRLIPEGRVGAVRVAPSATGVDPEVFSHCPSVDVLVADAEGEVHRIPQILTAVLKLSPAAASAALWMEAEMRTSLGSAYTNALSSRWTPVLRRSGTYYDYRDYSRVTRFELDISAGIVVLQKKSSGYKIQYNGSYGNSVVESVGNYEFVGQPGNIGWYSCHHFMYSPTYGMCRDGNGHFDVASSADVSIPAHIVDSAGNTVFCKAAATMTVGGVERIVLIAPPYTIGVTWDPQNGSFTDGGTTYTSSNPKYVDSNIDEDGTNTYPGFSHPKNVKSNDPKKVFYGWNTDKNATKDTPTGWWYKADGTVDVTSTKTSATLYAIYQDGFPMNWNVSKFGGSTASVGGRIAGTTNVWTASGNDGQEVVAISDSVNSTGKVRFPKATHPKNNNGAYAAPAADATTDGMRFLGWTNNADGSTPSGGYVTWDDGEFTVSASSLVSPTRTINVTPTNSTWYAVWESQLTFDADSYGGSVYGKTGDNAKRSTTWVKNNQAFTSFPAAKTTGANAGDFVPNRYGNADAANWRFKGWTTQANPNNTGGVLGGTTARASSLSPASGYSYTPNGATTYYGVWECAVSWGATDPPGSAAVGTTTANVNTGDLLYGYTFTSPGVINTPASHTFYCWTDPLNHTWTDASGRHQVETSGTINASWLPNIYKVVLKGMKGRANVDAATGNRTDAGDLFVKYGAGWYTDAGCATADQANLAAITAPSRDGFTAIGYTKDPVSTTPSYWHSGTSAADWAFDAGANQPASTIFDNTTSSSETVDVNGQTLKVAYLYPVWKTEVEVDAQGGVLADGSTPANQTLLASYSAPVPQATVPADVTKTGYRFLGWKAHYDAYIDASGASHPAADGELYAGRAGERVNVPCKTTFTAQWEAVRYNITLDVNTGSLDTDNAVLAVASYGSWDSEKSVWSVPTDLAANNTVTGSYTVEDGTSGLVTLPTFTCSGYTLQGWKVVENVSDVAYDASSGKYVQQAGGAFKANGTLASDESTNPFTFTTGTGAGDIRGSFKLQAVWSAAIGYDLTTRVYLDGVAAGAATDLYDVSVAIPSEYYVSGLALTDLVAKPGYTFAGWKAVKRESGADVSVLQQGGAAVDNAAASAAPVRQGEGAAVSIAGGTTGDNAITLAAYFTTNEYALKLDLGDVPDASFVRTVSGWTSNGDGTYTYAPGFTVSNVSVGGTAPAAKVQIPTPVRAGYTFKGWAENDPVSGSGTQSDPYVLDLSATYDAMKDYTLTAQWGPQGYSIAYAVKHSTVTPDAGARENLSIFTGDTISGTNAVTVTPLRADATSGSSFDSRYYASFDGWLVKGANLTGVSGWTYDSALSGWKLSADAGTANIAIGKDNVGKFFPSADASGNYSVEFVALYTPTRYNAKIDLAGGTYKNAEPVDPWAGSGESWSVDYTCESADIALPVPSAYGKRFLGWNVTEYSTDARNDADIENTSYLRASDACKIPSDSIRFRTYTADWEGVEDEIEFVYNADQSGEVGTGHPTGPASATPVFGEAMPVFAASAAPARTGYDFVGYFDTPNATGGKQYYTASMVGARTWDKAPEFESDGVNIIPHKLYARWTPEPPAGTNPENEPKPGTITPAPPAAPDPSASTHAAFSAKKGEGGAVVTENYFDAYYNGFFMRAIDDTVTVSLDSYVLADKADGTQLTAKDIYDAFERSGEAKPYLQGFIVDSTKSIIAFADIARGASFSFAFKVSDLQSDVADAASFALDGLKLTALYTSKPYNFDKPEGGEPPSIEPEDGDEILAVFDANGGTFAGGDTTTYTVTTYANKNTGDDAQGKYVKLPPQTGVVEIPARGGHTFLGWSLADECAVDSDHSDNPTADLFLIEDTTTKHYIAHWKENGYPVRLFKNDGTNTSVSTKNDAIYGASEPLSVLLDEDPYTAPNREGYLFLGYFDAEKGGTQYYTSAGLAAKPFDKVTSEGESHVSFYAHWLYLGGGDPTDPDDVDPFEPFPGVKPVTTIPAAPAEIEMVARDGLGRTDTVALFGNYDGYYATPAAAGSTDAAVSMYSYAPKDGNVDCTIRKIIERFEANNDPVVSGGAYLQGFCVESTGSFVSIADLWAGNPVSIVMKKSDLDAAVTPASVTFLSDKVEAVYGPTSPIKPDDDDVAWPEAGDPGVPGSGTQIYNVFDARGGLFPADAEDGSARGKRFTTVASSYNLPVEAPADAPTYEAIDPTYSFVGWVSADDPKTLVFDANGEPANAADPKVQMATTPATYYAKYEQTEFTFKLHDAEDGVKGIHEIYSGETDGTKELGEFKVYKGQELTDEKTNGFGTALAPASASFTQHLPEARAGYDFIGWFYKQELADGSTKLVPFYLNNDGGFASQYIAKNKLSVVSPYDNGGASNGWGDVSEARNEGDVVDLYALWNVKSYEITWTYNWLGRDYVYTEHDADGTERDLTKVTSTVTYGDAIDDTEVPTITDPSYEFIGWTSGKTDKRVVVRKPVVFTDDTLPPDTTWSHDLYDPFHGDDPYYFTQDGDEFRFEPGNIDGIDDRGRTFELFAQFDEDDEVSYGFRIYLAQSADRIHGYFTDRLPSNNVTSAGVDVPYYSSTYQPSKGIDLKRVYIDGGLIRPDSGYRPLKWYDSATATETVDPVIAAGTTGFREFYLEWTANPYTIGFTVDTLKKADGSGFTRPLGADDAPEPYQVDLSRPEELRNLLFKAATGAKGYSFAGWAPLNGEGEFDEDKYDALFVEPDGTVTFDESYIAAAYGPNSKEGTITYGAVWEPLKYKVVFNEGGTDSDGNEIVDTYMLESAPADAVADDAESATLTLPYPHTTQNERVFTNWSVDHKGLVEDCDEWRGGTKITLTDLLKAVRKSDDNKRGDLPEEDGCLVIKMSSIWNGDAIISVDVPLQVNILLDPWQPDREDGAGKIITNNADAYYVEGEDAPVTAEEDGTLPDKVFANAWVGTPEENDARGGVRIESVTFERGDAELFENAAGDDDSGKFDLLVYGGGRGEAVTPLRINLGQERAVVTRSDMGSGFERTITSADPLLLYYDLDFSRAGATLEGYPLMTNTETDPMPGINGAKKGRAIARLYYTIGLVPPVPAGPAE